MKEKSSDIKNYQKEIIMEFLRVIAARPSKRYPVFVWKVSSIYPSDMLAMFNHWLNLSKYKNVNPFKKQRYFFKTLYKSFDSFGLTWHIKSSYKHDKIYFGNLRLKENGCRMLMDIGARTYIGD